MYPNGQVFRETQCFGIEDRQAPTEQHTDIKTENPPNEKKDVLASVIFGYKCG